MILINKGTTIETGFSKGGNYLISKEKDGKKLLLSTPHPTRFLELLNGAKPEPNEIKEFDFKCTCCEAGFNSGAGTLIGDILVCNPCRQTYSYFEWYRQHVKGVTDKYIYE